jgi:hypothetical protein
MAATIAKAIGHDRTRVKETHRLGSEHSEAEAATWRTFARAYVNAAGAGYVEVVRDGFTLGRIAFGSEDEPSEVLVLGPYGPVKAYAEEKRR